MGVTVGKNTVSDFHKKVKEANEKACFIVLSYAGEQAVTFARQKGTYTDRTGNLRKSTGYVIMNNGRVVSGKFQAGKSATKAQSYAVQIAGEVAVKHPKGWVLIVVAGMEYAAYVEAKGYDVLSGAGNTLRSNISEIKEKILSKLK